MPTIIAHRGASYDAPENTLAAVELAWAQGADAVETDVRLTRDGHIVVLHDTTTRRVAGVDMAVTEHSVPDLRRLDVGCWKAAAFAGTCIPTLHEVIATMPPGKRLFIEVKCGPEIVPALANLLTRPGYAHHAFAIIAFEAATLAAIKAALPGVAGYWLSSFQQDAVTGEFTPTIQELIGLSVQGGFDGVDLDGRGPVDAAAVQQLREAGLQCYVWTVNDAEAARRLAAAGVDGITTDRPGWLRSQLETGHEDTRPQPAT